jgi:Mrp family chromosome partitioning ATPase
MLQKAHGDRFCRTRRRCCGYRATMNTVTRVLVVANQKGGVAKTTTVASLGAAMEEKGKAGAARRPGSTGMFDVFAGPGSPTSWPCRSTKCCSVR